jgi:uncharacterized protein
MPRSHPPRPAPPADEGRGTGRANRTGFTPTRTCGVAMPFEWRSDPDASISRGAVVLTSFPTAGLAATVAGYYILRTLGLPRIGVVDSADFPPVAVISGGLVNPPIRVYGKDDLAMVLTEFPPPLASIGSITRAILDGAERIGARLILGVEGVMPHPTSAELEGGDGSSAPRAPEEKVWVISSKTDHALQEGFRRARVDPLTDGIIGGVSGSLLVRGQQRSTPVAVLLVSARETDGLPDHRAGATLIEALDRYLPGLKIDTAPLRSQAERIERAIRTAIRQRQAPGPTASGEPPSELASIYR